MTKNKYKRDIISEQEFNAQMRPTSTAPEEDSPDDSEKDSGSEFLMGLNYMPDEKKEFESDGEEPGEIVFADEKSTAPSEFPSNEDPNSLNNENKLPENARVVSSGQPSPWSDLDSKSDTH